MTPNVVLMRTKVAPETIALLVLGVFLVWALAGLLATSKNGTL